MEQRNNNGDINKNSSNININNLNNQNNYNNINNIPSNNYFNYQNNINNPGYNNSNTQNINYNQNNYNNINNNNQVKQNYTNINNIPGNNYFNYQNNINNPGYNNSNINYNEYNIQNDQNTYQNDKVKDKTSKEKIKFGKKNIFSFKFKIILIILIILILVLLNVIERYVFKSYSVIFHLNGADEIESSEMKCTSNLRGECFITLPLVKRYDGEIMGFSKNMNDHDAQYKIGEKIKIDSDMFLSVISKKTNKLVIDKGDIDDIREETISCEAYNNDSCEVSVPMFNKLGYKIDGYTKDKYNKNDIIKFNSKIELNDDVILYPVYDEYQLYNYNGTVHYPIEKSVYLYNTYLDIGYNCDKSNTDLLIKKLNNLYEKYPFYAYNSKLIILDDKEYNSFATIEKSLYTSGITVINNQITDNPRVVIRCNENLYTYIVAIHELSHAFDFRYKSIYGHFMSDENELIELRNKYKNSYNRPLSDYAYSDGNNGFVKEFFAELLTFYYINYVDTTTQLEGGYYRGNFPDDMKKVAEKYLCIGKNNFDKSKCS